MLKQAIKVLGIDPGIERLGWSLVERDSNKFKYLLSGVKRTDKNDKKHKRLLEIHDFVEKLIKEEKPEAISIEKIFFSNNAKTALIIGEVRGIILMKNFWTMSRTQ
ncbi:crossover junction endodeoxyribonuclease RuvC [Candidatus Giovannonibacteria bacterium]|nr:crossover junction endodeoxyribonuclease RuvC [Candidatus Giovannonibacteria bacterium]